MFSSLDLCFENCVSNRNVTEFLTLRRDVDDPEYKPAPALMKDDMEVRKRESNALVSVYDEAYYVLNPAINIRSLLTQDDASSPGDLVVTDNAGGEN